MAKDPAFLFYPNDWLGGTMGMTFEEKGAYMELLMMQFNRGHMTSHMIGQTVGQLWVKLQDKFIQDAAGLWYNVRLEEEKDKRKKFTDSRKNNVSGSNQHTKKIIARVGHMTSHMENANVNGIEYYKGAAEAFAEIVENDKAMESYRRQLKGRIRSATDFEVKVGLKDFLNRQSADEIYFKTRNKPNVIRHYSNWLEKQPIDKILKLAEHERLTG